MKAHVEIEAIEGERPSMMRITGRNAAYALGLGLGFAFALSLGYTFLSVIADSVDQKQIDVWMIPKRIVGFFQLTVLCSAPIVFLISFALFQRQKIKY